MACITCGKTDSLHSTQLYVMEWTEYTQNFQDIKQTRVCGAVSIELCESCLNQALSKKAKGLFVSGDEKKSVAVAISSKNYSADKHELAAAAMKRKIDEPNAGKNSFFSAWANANGADHLLNETYIPAEYVLACLVKLDNGDSTFVAHEPIRYILHRPSEFKYIQLNPNKDTFELVHGTGYIAPEWIDSIKDSLKACRAFLQTQP
jgi:hypothetical protein